MPRVEIRVPRYQDYLAPGHEASYNAYGRAGQALQSGLEHAQSRRDANRRARAEMEVDAQRAQASLLKEANALADKQAAATEDEANRQAVVTTIQEEGAKARGQAEEEQVKQAMASPGGILGPFGMAQALAKGAPNTLKVKARWDGYQELAKRMDPRFAQSWLNDTLQRDAAEEKQRIITEGYAEEMKQLDTAIKEGWFDDPFGPDSKGGEVSDGSQQMAEEIGKGIQTGLAAGQAPGAASKTLALAHAKRKQLVARKAAWEEADQRAAKLFTSIRELAEGAGTGIDPATGGSLGAELADRLAVAQGEWAGTRGLPGMSEEYRKTNSPDKALGELKKILFRAQVQADPQQFLENAALPPGPSQDQVVAAATGAQGAIGVPAQGAQGPQDGGARRAPTTYPFGRTIEEAVENGYLPRSELARTATQDAQGAGQAPQGRKGKQKAPAASREEQVGAVIQEELGRLQAAPKNERRAAIKGMLDRLEHDFGLDMDDPGVAAAIKNAISQATGR